LSCVGDCGELDCALPDCDGALVLAHPAQPSTAAASARAIIRMKVPFIDNGGEPGSILVARSS